jgi:predicted Zn finger-like uncharacterized protein
MRIVCPKCDSQYEVSEDAIPEAGRDVQCAKCSEIWFQDPPNHASASVKEAAPAQTPEPEVQYEPDSVEAAIQSAFKDTETTAQTAESSTPEMSTVFRSLRADPVPTPEPEASELEPSASSQPVAEPEAQDDREAEARARRKISPEVQSILQQEAEFAAKAKSPIIDDAMDAASNVATPFKEPVAPQPNIDGLSRRMQEVQAEKENNAREQAESDAEESVTLASAKSLRDILESEAIDQVDIPQAPKAEEKKEPSLDQLGMKRPTPIIQPETQTPIITPASKIIEEALAKEPELPKFDQSRTVNAPDVKDIVKDEAAKDTVVKTGKAVFTDIDELNSNLDIEEDEDDKDEDLANFADEVPVEKASKFSVGFLTAAILAIVATSFYVLAPSFSKAVPATEGFFTAYQTKVNSGRMVLQDMYYQGGEPGFDNLLNNAKSKLTQ